MAHRTFHLTNEAANTLLTAYLMTNNGPLRTRLQAVRLYGLGYAVTEIYTITGCARSSLMDWCRTYQEGGLSSLNDHRVGGNRAKLTPAQVMDLSQKLRQYSPRSLFGPQTATLSGHAWTVADLQHAVQYWYGVTYHSTASYSTLFDRCGFSYHRPTKVFKSRNDQAVMDFETQLEKN